MNDNKKNKSANRSPIKGSLYNETRHKLQAVSHSALDPFRMAAYGDSGVNRSIGRQNGYRQDTIYDVVSSLPSDSPVNFNLLYNHRHL